MSEIADEGQGAVVKNDRPDWLPDNFNDPADLANSYKEAQRELTQTKQELSALSEQVSALVEQQQYAQQPTYDPDADPVVAAYEQALEMGDTRTQLAIQASIAQQAVNSALQQAQQNPALASQQQAQNSMYAALADQQMASRYGEEWQEIRGDVGELLQSHPNLVPDEADLNKAVEGLSMAAEVVKSRRLTERQKAFDNQQRQEKKMAQGITGQSGTTPEAQEAREHLKQILGSSMGYGYSR